MNHESGEFARRPRAGQAAPFGTAKRTIQAVLYGFTEALYNSRIEDALIPGDPGIDRNNAHIQTQHRHKRQIQPEPSENLTDFSGKAGWLANTVQTDQPQKRNEHDDPPWVNPEKTIIAHVLVADHVAVELRLVDPAQYMFRPAQQLLPGLIGQTFAASAQGVAVFAHALDRIIDAAVVMVGIRRRHILPELDAGEARQGTTCASTGTTSSANTW